MTVAVDNQRRAGATRERLLSAAERLFVEHGIARTSTRAILQAAGQRNESALQYHFGGREGLVQELYERRGAQIIQEREVMIEDFDSADRRAGDSSDAIRELCAVAFLPAVRVARADPTFVQFLKLVGQLAFLPGAALMDAQARYEGQSLVAVGERLRPLLDVPETLLAQRLELMSRMAAVALTQRARAEEPFDGSEAELFFSNLVDAMASVLQADISTQTAELLRGAGQKPKGAR